MDKRPKKTQAEKDLRDSWTTPEWVWKSVLAALDADEFDLDPCSNEWSTVPARKKYTKADDGLTKKWRGLVWLNPPYSQPLQHEFIDKAYSSEDASTVALIPFAPQTEQWQDCPPIRGVIIPRLAFVPPPGVEASSPGPVPHALCFFGDWDSVSGLIDTCDDIAYRLSWGREDRYSGTRHWTIQ